jgi:hypothetical protein
VKSSLNRVGATTDTADVPGSSSHGKGGGKANADYAKASKPFAAWFKKHYQFGLVQTCTKEKSLRFGGLMMTAQRFDGNNLNA